MSTEPEQQISIVEYAGNERLRAAGRFCGRVAAIGVSASLVLVLAGPPIVRYLGTEAADAFTERVQHNADQLDFSEDQIKKFKERIADEDITGFLIREIADEDVSPEEFVEALFGNVDDDAPTNNSTEESALALNEAEVDHFQELVNDEAALDEVVAEIEEGSHTPDEIVEILFGSTELQNPTP